MLNPFVALVLASAVVATPVNRSHAPARAATTAATARAEKHPTIRAAMRALEAAKADLQAAAHDFKGHRVDAIKAIDAALVQLQLALDADK